jgi:DNA-directed RNA polymerase I subunit RPA1
MPKLLFVGIVERACRTTVIREIPGILDCFQVKDDGQKGSEPEIKVPVSFDDITELLLILLRSADH